MYGYIYKTTNLINNKIYIGQKKSKIFLKEKYLGSGLYLKRAVNKYGKDNFKVELIDKADDREQLNELELYYINLYDSTNINIGYNIANGAVGGGDVWVTNGIENHHISYKIVGTYLEQGYHLGLTHHEGYTKISTYRNQQISKALKGKSKSKEHIENHRQALLNKKRHWYNNGINNICLAEGEVIPEGYKRGRFMSEESKKKNSESCKGRIPWNKGLKKLK